MTLVAEPVRVLPFAAASGIAWVGDDLHVVADDELELLTIDLRGDRPDRRTPLLEGELPPEHRARKAAKPDLEALTVLPDGALLALGSGSTPARDRGVVVRERPAVIDLAPLHEALARELPDLNLEGAAVRGGELLLLQRGNGAAGCNAVVALDLATVLTQLADGFLGPQAVRGITEHELGEAGGWPLSFTDACALPDGRVVVTAVAEAVLSTYEDGPLAAAAVGWLGEPLVALEPLVKVEGVASDGRSLLLVADSDTPGQAAPLLRAPLPPAPAA